MGTSLFGPCAQDRSLVSCSLQNSSVKCKMQKNSILCGLGLCSFLHFFHQSDSINSYYEVTPNLFEHGGIIIKPLSYKNERSFLKHSRMGCSYSFVSIGVSVGEGNVKVSLIIQASKLYLELLSCGGVFFSLKNKRPPKK